MVGSYYINSKDDTALHSTYSAQSVAGILCIPTAQFEHRLIAHQGISNASKLHHASSSNVVHVDAWNKMLSTLAISISTHL